jgi:hypothetical protein
MHRPRPDKLHEELDALLDGRPVELTDELAPLVEAADILRIELAAYRLDAEVADRHLERVLDTPANVVQLPVRRPSSGWDVRRRVVAVALAAALVLAPATIASAASLPGQAMYPFKLAIEQVRLASVQWSPGREAGERTRVADERLEEVQSLFELEMYAQLPGALKAFNRAYVAAQVAVNEALQEGELTSNVAAKLKRVQAGGGQVVQQLWKAATAQGSIKLTGPTAEAVKAAAEQSQDVLPPPPTAETAPPGGTPSQSTAASPATTDPSAGPPPSTAATTQTTTPPPTAPQTTTPPPTTPTTTTPPTTEAPNSTEAANPDTPAQGRDGDNPAGTGGTPAGEAASENAPPAAAP